MITETNIFLEGKLPPVDMTGLQASYAHLPADTFAEAGLRSRRYSRFWLGADNSVKKLTQQDFMQTKEYNSYVGDVHRKFEPIEDALIHDPAFKEMLIQFRLHTGLSAESVIEAHQIRWHCDRHVKIPAPEGIHRDGFDFVGMFQVNVHNVGGGDIMVYETPESAPMYKKQMQPGEYIMVNDKKIYHFAAPLVPMPNNDNGYWDLMVLTANKN